MATLVLRLDPADLANPDLDLRYAVPDLLAVRSGGSIRDGGYEYEDFETSAPAILIYLDVDEPTQAIALVESLLRDELVLGNRLDHVRPSLRQASNE